MHLCVVREGEIVLAQGRVGEEIHTIEFLNMEPLSFQTTVLPNPLQMGGNGRRATPNPCPNSVLPLIPTQLVS